MADNESSYCIKSEVYVGKGTYNSSSHLPIPTQAVLELTDCLNKTNRNITTDNYYTSISLAKELKECGVTLIGTMKKNKTCIPKLFLEAAKEGAIHYGFDHENDFYYQILSTMHLEEMKIEPNGKEEINDFYNQTKGGVDSHDHKCSLYTTARKTNCWPRRFFYGIIDSALMNAFIIMKKNDPGFAGNRDDERVFFLKSLSRSLIVPQAKSQLEII